MKLLLKLLFSLVLLLLVVIVLGYVTLRTHWGITTACRWISDATAYHLSIQRLTHDWADPFTIELEKVTFGEDGQPALLMADTLSLTLSGRQLVTPSHFSQISIEQGTLVLSNLTPETTLPFSADHLLLQGVKLLNPYPTNCLSAEKLDGQLSPWQPSQQALLGKKFRFNFSAAGVQVANHQFDTLAAQGDKDQQRLNINQISGAIERGTFAGKLSRTAEGKWQVPQLQLDNIRFQTTKPLAAVLSPALLRDTTLQNIAVNHLSIVGPDWVINDLSATGQNLTGDSSSTGHLSLDAQSLVLGTEFWSQPHLSLNMNNGDITLNQFNVGWAKGTISARGQWQKKTGSLTLEELNLRDIHYTLPTTWRQFLQTKLPEPISAIKIERLSMDNGLLIDINPEFPFQMTATHITGAQLLVAQHHQWGLWAGDAEYYAAATTFNRQDVRALWFKLNANNQTVAMREIKGIVEGGPVVGQLEISQSAAHPFSLELRGENVAYHALNHWFWSRPLSGKGRFSLQLKGDYPSLTTGLSQLEGEFNTPSFTQQLTH